jgi:hypothetical protein
VFPGALANIFCQQLLLALGITLCIVIVVLAKKALKKIEEQELEREAQEAAAAAAAEADAAAEAGTAGPFDSKERASLDGSKQPLSLSVEGKLAAAAAGSGAAAGGVCGTTASSSDGDLQVIVVDDASTAQGSNLSLDRGDSLIPAGTPPAAAQAEPSATSRASSVSSLRGLLNSRFQRSS